MAQSRRSRARLSGPLLAAGVLAQAAGAADEVKCNQPASFDAAHVEYKPNAVVLRDVVISQCDLRVQAREARATGGLNFENSHWTLEGSVRIRLGQRGNLSSDQAVVDFQNNKISTATITGKPAEFEQKRSDSDAVAHGHAREIVYEVGPGTVRLSDDAWLSDGRTEIRSPRIVYNIRQEQVQADTQAGRNERVRITIGPKPAPQSPKPE